MSQFGKIIFPVGYAGNHLRWLLYLDDKFPNPYGDQTVDSKLKFIQTRVYPQQRSWNNWLQFEWSFRNQLDQYIEVNHDCWNWENSNDKELYLSATDFMVPCLYYFHLNLSLNNATPESLIRDSKQWVSEFDVVKNKLSQYQNKKIVLADSLFGSKLSYDLYKEVIDFYNFDDRYELAQTVHQWYNEIRKNSVKDFCDYFISENFLDRLEQIKQIV